MLDAITTPSGLSVFAADIISHQRAGSARVEKEAEGCAYSALTAPLKITQMKKTQKQLFLCFFNRGRSAGFSITRR
jgi:hypothetical protein